MSLTLPKPAGLLRSRLGRALAGFIPEADRDEAIVAIVRTIEELGISIEGHGWLEDDEPLANAFRQDGLDSEGLPFAIKSDPEELFLNVEDVGELPSRWECDTDDFTK